MERESIGEGILFSLEIHMHWPNLDDKNPSASNGGYITPPIVLLVA